MRVDIEARRDKILRIIINTYIVTGNPVSSRMICKQYRLDLCPASVRNVMADLEERGYITHMHTSAGRVPTDKGYRFYVDKLVEHSGLTPQERVTIDKEYLEKRRALEEVIHKTSGILSNFTNYIGMVSQPALERSRFKRIQFTQLSRHLVCVTLVTNAGITKSSVIGFNLSIDADNLQRIESFLNSQLEDTPLTQVKIKLNKLLIQERNAFFHVLKQAIDLIDLSALIEDRMRFSLEGVSNVLSFPEFEDSQMVRSLMRVIDEKLSLAELVQEVIESEPAQRKVKVFIGEENPGVASMSGCAAILIGYQVEGEIVGALGIIGPKRMDYGKSIATVQYVAGILSNVLSEFSL
ncbi:MAG: heat-inducible transcriptional repressor HrcA [Candidatus Omnitrophica bacterium]|nr:heat-inducible transcriptional repressor HrcA [Candidatus Omnitrophota bacterium]MBU4478778.1 heat-inducible transcriptional repressor HrcA [Candidatus Omnitrophota bacterium]MCG2704077.1 heat-inducible transcriptional repressor HrcA [Candidatus Omnitrophota bacterium]